MSRRSHSAYLLSATIALLATRCSAYDTRLIHDKPPLGSDGGVDVIQLDAATRDASAPASIIDASAPDAMSDANLPDCYPTNNPDCPMSCHEVCNGQDDDCDGKIDEIDARSACKLSAASSVCAEAQCLIASCDEGHVDCDELVDDGCEATLDSIEHCGVCGHNCTLPNAEPRCTDASCQIDHCTGRFGDCDQRADNGCERPLDTVTDCGACSKACTIAHATTSCADADCKFASCNAGFGDCNNDSAKLADGDGCESDLSQPDNCGACGNRCSNPKPYCSGGKCTSLACDSGHADCDGDNVMCETDLHTNTNCGACGALCGPLANANVSCSSGACVATCKSGYKSCDNSLANGCETDLHTNTNCGNCGATCTYANATTSCTTGSCQLVACSSGYGDCNGKLAADGCEQRLNTNTHCGQCGKACSLANAASSCSSGSCQVGSCNGGFANCDGRADTGCEINTQTDELNCGGCNQACPSNFTCQAGHCVCTSDSNCSSGQKCCAGSCVNTGADEANCGSCGNACSSGSTCCSGNCKNLASDTNNCGTCGNQCGSNTNRCSSGSCRCGNDGPCSSFNRCCSNGCGIGLLCF